MWIVKVALSRPYTFIGLALLILILSPVIIHGPRQTSSRTATPSEELDNILDNIGLPYSAINWMHSDEQQRQVRPLLLHSAKEAIRDRADLAVTRLDIRQQVSAHQPDLSHVNDRLQNIAVQEAQRLCARLTTMQDIRHLLTPAQQEHWQAVHARCRSGRPREHWSGVRG
jgi:hypothetical protein